MTNTKSTKRALLSSVMALFLCFTMLLGTTFAWFTDSVTSANNIIKSGNLKVTMEYADGTADPSDVAWKDASNVAIFTSTLWEPGYVEAHHIKITNVGSLALKYELAIELENGGKIEDIAKVIDVYYADPAVQLTRENLETKATRLGTIAEVLDGLDTYGELQSGASDTITLALKMQEGAGNTYMNQQIGPFSIKLLATQLSSENDSFDNKYDEGASLFTVKNAAELVSALELGGNYKLDANIELNETVKIPAGVEVTLDLNGNTLSGSILAPKANLTIENGKFENKDSSVSAIEINAGKLTLTDVEISSARHAVRIDGDVTATIDGGTYGIVGSKKTTQHAVNVSGGANVTINGGTFVGPAGTDSDSGSAVKVQADSTVTINGGSFSGGKNHTLSVDGTLIVKGGTFDQDPSAYVVDEGYVAVKNDKGIYTVYPPNDEWDGSIDTSWYPETQALSSTGKEYSLYTAEQLAGLAALTNSGVTFKGDTILLKVNVDLQNKLWTPIGSDANGFSATFDGQNHTVTNLYVNQSKTAGLFGYALNGGNVKNLTVKNALVLANDYAGAIMGRGYTDIDNCHVTNVTVITTPYLTDEGTYDGGTKAGGVIGQMLEGSANTVTNCSATNVKIYGFRDIGGVVGMVHNNNSAEYNTASDVTLGYILFDKITGDKNENAGAIYGRVQSSATVSPAKDSADNLNFKQVYAIYDAISACSLANYVNNGDSFEGKTVVMLNDIDLSGVEWTPIGIGEVDGNWIGFNGIFDGQNHTISNVRITKSGGWRGIFGLVGRGTSKVEESISNLTVKNVVIEEANRMSGAVVGQLYGNIENCHVENVTINAIPNMTNGGTYDNGDKIGGVVGWFGDNGNNHYIKNCSAKNVTLKAYRDVGGIVGYIGTTSTVENCSVDTVSITVDQVTNSYGVKDTNAGGVVGRVNTPVTVQNNTEANVTVATVVSTGEALDTAIANGKEDIVLLPGTYNIENDISNVTIYGCEGATIQNVWYNDMKNVTFKNVDFEADYIMYMGGAEGTVVFENCTFSGARDFGIHFDHGNGDVVFKNCTISGFNTFGASLNSVTFNNCDFVISDTANYNLINIWGSTVTFTDCTFDENWYYVGMINKTGTATINVENVTYNGTEQIFCSYKSSNTTWNFTGTTFEVEKWN